MIKARLRAFVLFLALAISGFGLISTGVWSFPSQKIKEISLEKSLYTLAKKAAAESDRVTDRPIYSYPYVRLAEELQELGVSEITIFSYGSLMSQASAARTLSPETLATRVPAIAFGAKRLFNRDVKIKPNSRWGIPGDPSARGMLNVELTGNYQEVVNGVVFQVKAEDIPAMLNREEGYDLVPILYTNWDDFVEGQEPTFHVAYTFRAKNLGPYTSSDILPRPNYYELTRDAAKEYGPKFYALWLRSTYHADGVTLVEEQMGQFAAMCPLAGQYFLAK